MIDARDNVEYKLFVESNCLPYVIVGFDSLTILIATEVPFRAVSCSLPFASIEVTFPMCSPPRAGTHNGVPTFKIPSTTSTPTIIGSFWLKTC